MWRCWRKPGGRWPPAPSRVEGRGFAGASVLFADFVG